MSRSGPALSGDKHLQSLQKAAFFCKCFPEAVQAFAFTGTAETVKPSTTGKRICVCNVRRIGRYSWITRTCNGRTASGPVAVHMGKVIVISAFKPNRFADRKARGSRGESSFYGTTSKSKIGTRPPEISLGGPGIDLDGPHASFGGPSQSASMRKHPR